MSCRSESKRAILFIDKDGPEIIGMVSWTLSNQLFNSIDKEKNLKKTSIHLRSRCAENSCGSCVWSLFQMRNDFIYQGKRMPKRTKGKYSGIELDKKYISEGVKLPPSSRPHP